MVENWWSLTIEVATDAKRCVELLNIFSKNLSSKITQIWTCMLYKIWATLRYNNLREANNKRYTQKYNPKEQLLIIGKDWCLFICGAKAYKTDKQHVNLITTVEGLVTFLWQMVVYQRQDTADAKAYHGTLLLRTNLVKSLYYVRQTCIHWNDRSIRDPITLKI